MDEMKRLYREALRARIDALEAARKAFLSHEPEAADSIQRLAHTIRGSGSMYGYPEVTEAATTLETAEEDQLLPALDELLVILQQVASSGEEQKSGILIIEDDPVQSRILQTRLAATNRSIYAAETAAQAEEILSTEDVSLILLDLILPDTDGRNFLIKLRERPERAGLPVIVVSAKGNPGTKAECFALGADAYFEKPVDLEILAPAVAAKLQTSGEAARKSRTDALTGLPNRAAFAEEYGRAQSLAIRSRSDLALAILDLDRFKSLNDDYGHRMGDEVLRRVRPILTKALRQTDYLARWGGEEFVILFPKADTQGAAHALRKALEAFRSEEFKVEDQTVSNLSFSAGVVEVSEGTQVEEAVAEADRLLYQAKESGRAQVLTTESKVEIKGKQILLAEDDELVASVVKHRLGREGFEVAHFTDGTSALAAAKDMEVSLVILDVKMPGMDGFEVLANLRKITHYRTIPVVMLTSMGSETDIVRGFQLGADDYIMKPFSPIELIARIRRLVKDPGHRPSRPVKKILLLDDDPIILLTASTVLEKSGDFSVQQARSVPEALRYARQEKPDALLSDLIMPEMDGIALLEQIQNDSKLSDIPVVFLTAKTDPAQIEDLVKRGAAGVISKPLNVDELAAQVKQILKVSMS